MKVSLKFLCPDEKGQVSLFIALIFQVLFLFFAMVINIGLVVHHKINLQNSLDLAAYYASSKQAENLNAIAHINYQIRQSWKLMAWRYRMLGSAGDFDTHPYRKQIPNAPFFNPNPLKDEIPPDNAPNSEALFYEAPTFCITYSPFKPSAQIPVGENTCKDLAKMSGITLFKAPDIQAGFLGFANVIKNATENALTKIRERCMIFGSLNMIYLSTFAASFNIDQRDRQAMIAAISRSMSKNTNDFYDLDGDSGLAGAEKTFKRNLTIANRDGVQNFELYNSLSDPQCNTDGVTANLPPKWLKQIKIYPGFTYLDTRCDNVNQIIRLGKPLPYGIDDTNNQPYHYHIASPEIADLREYTTQLLQLLSQDKANPDSVYNYSTGVEKNPWCMSYVGAKATVTPNIPFLPMGTITLQAKAFAKPFGGRIGPWYQSGWTRGAPRSDSGDMIDPLIPPRFIDAANFNSFYTDDSLKKRLAANYSRFPGDLYGLKSKLMVGEFGRAIYELDPNWKNHTNMPIESGSAPNLRHWSHLPPSNDGKLETMDWLAWDTDVKHDASMMRYLELSAVIPDAFDLAYYSIEPDFYNNYYERITQKFIPKIDFDRQFKPDLGYHKGNPNFENYSVKDQIRDVIEKNAAGVIHIDLDENGLSFLSKNWTDVLTGWSESNLTDYKLSDDDFGKCTAFPRNAEADGKGVPNPAGVGNCLKGGRTGYSVKFISGDYLRSEKLELGGPGVAPGGVLNPPPANF